MNKEEFISALSSIGIDIDSDQYKKLEEYYEILVEKNKVMNLTGITDKNQVFLKHFYDSLTINKIINLKEINNICDLGSGAGFPGVVLKIVFPNIKITLVDSLNKRVKFLNDLIKQLDLMNIKAVNKRIEEFSVENEEKYDLVTARAVAPTSILLEIGIKCVKVNGSFILMKGKEEIIGNNVLEQLNLIMIKNIKFFLPQENSERTLTLFKKEKATKKIFPRKYSEIKKRPL